MESTRLLDNAHFRVERVKYLKTTNDNNDKRKNETSEIKSHYRP